jgi:predicted small metal-binding protein
MLQRDIEPRKYFDCREFDRHGSCSFRISGEESEVLEEVIAHSVSVHGYRGGDELRICMRVALRDEA